MTLVTSNNKVKHILSLYWPLLIGVFLFLLIKLFQISHYHFLVWDEAVYVSMGKYLFSNGASGYFEIMRPLILPLFIGSIWKLGFHNPVVLKIAMIPITLLAMFFVYKIGKKLFNHTIGMMSALIFIGTGTIFFYSSAIFTGILATTCMLISINAYMEHKYITTGIFAGLSILTRFPFGLFILALGIFIFAELLYSTTKNQKIKIFKKGLIIISFIIIITIPFFLFNYISYRYEVPKTTDAIFRPLLDGANDVGIKSGFTFDAIWFYFFESLCSQPLMLFGFLGLFIGISYSKNSNNKKLLFSHFKINALPFFNRKSMFEKQHLLFYLIIIFFGIFFMYYNVKDLRFGIPILPLLAIYAANMIYGFNRDKKNTTMKTWLLYIPHIIIFGVLISNIIWVMVPVYDPNPYSVSNFIEEENLKGPILSSDPYIGAYVATSIEISYFKYNPSAFTGFFMSRRFPQIVISVPIFNCETNECISILPDILYEMNNEYHVIFETKEKGIIYSILEADYLTTDEINKTQTSNLMNLIASKNSLPSIY